MTQCARRQQLKSLARTCKTRHKLSRSRRRRKIFAGSFSHIPPPESLSPMNHGNTSTELVENRNKFHVFEQPQWQRAQISRFFWCACVRACVFQFCVRVRGPFPAEKLTDAVQRRRRRAPAYAECGVYCPLLLTRRVALTEISNLIKVVGQHSNVFIYFYKV